MPPAATPTPEQLGLDRLDKNLSIEGIDLLVDHRGRRDIYRVRTRTPDGVTKAIFVKRIFKSRLKDALWSLIARGAVWSKSRTEFENYRTLLAAGIETAEPIGFKEQITLVWERSSLIITGAAAGIPLDDYLTVHPSGAERANLLTELGMWVRLIHDRGIAFPDLFARHVFVDDSQGNLRFSLIDVARLDQRPVIENPMRARDLAALQVSVPIRLCPVLQRRHFFLGYCAGTWDKDLAGKVQKRATYLLRRPKFAGFAK